MTDRREPEGGPDALDAAYRRASAADASRPSDATRAAILANARTVAATAGEQAKPAIETRRPAANDPFWWRSAAASVAIAVVGLMIWAPHFESRDVPSYADRRSKSAAVASAPAVPPPAAPSLAPTPVDMAAPDQRRLEELATERPVAAPRQLAARVPRPRESVESLAAAPPPAHASVAEPSASAGLVARADAPAADAALGGSPAAAERSVALNASPATDLRKAEVEEVVVTGAKRAHGGAAQLPLVAAAPAEAVARGSAANLVSGVSARDSLLEAAIARGDSERVRDLVAPTGALEERDARGRTPLMRAVEAGQAAVVRALLDVGADPNAVDAEGVRPRARAASRPDIAALLEERGGH